MWNTFIKEKIWARMLPSLDTRYSLKTFQNKFLKYKNAWNTHFCTHVFIMHGFPFVVFACFVPVGAVTVISPLELIRTKMQSKKFSYEELHRFVSKKVSEDGWISLWRGWAPTILRDVPFSGRIYLLHFKWLCIYHF